MDVLALSWAFPVPPSAGFYLFPYFSYVYYPALLVLSDARLHLTECFGRTGFLDVLLRLRQGSQAVLHEISPGSDVLRVRGRITHAMSASADDRFCGAGLG